MASDNALPLAAQVAAVQALLASDPKLTLEGIETDRPELSDGVREILSQRQKPAQSGAAPVAPMSVADTL